MEDGKPSVRQRWSRKRKFLLLSGIILAIMIALAVGLGIGLSRRGGESDEEDGGTATPTSPPLPTTGGSIWQPPVNASWQIVLQSPLDLSSSAKSVTPDVDIFDIDLFTNSQSTIDTLHRLNKKVICYFSAGSYEPSRPDSKDFKPEDLGTELDGWPGERWLKLDSQNVRNIMSKRLELAASKKCDAVDPDNVDAYNNKGGGVQATEQMSIDFLAFLTAKAASLNLGIGLKNAGDIIPEVLPAVQFSVNEECVQYSECSRYAAFIKAGKPVFHIEYPKGAPNVKIDIVQDICSTEGKAAGSERFSTVIKEMDLNGWLQFCNGTSATTAVANSES